MYFIFVGHEIYILSHSFQGHCRPENHLTDVNKDTECKHPLHSEGVIDGCFESISLVVNITVLNSKCLFQANNAELSEWRNQASKHANEDCMYLERRSVYGVSAKVSAHSDIVQNIT